MKLKAKVKGTPIDEMMHWRRVMIWTTDDRRVIGFRKIQLGIPEYRVNGKEFPVEQVRGVTRMEYIVQPNQQFDPQAF